MRKQQIVTGLAVMVAALLSAPIQAETQKLNSFRLGGQLTPLLSGDAGEGDGAPEYADLFSSGFGGSLEFQRKIDERLHLLLGVSLERFDGDAYARIQFEDLKRTSVYTGLRIDMESQSDWRPYGRFDLGATRNSSVEISYTDQDGRFTGTYWDASWNLMAGVGFGMEKQIGDWSVFGEAQVRYTNGPDGELGDMADADGSWTLPLRIGVSYHF